MTKLEAYKKILKTINDCDRRVKLAEDLSQYNLPRLIKREEVEEEFGFVVKDIHSSTWFPCGQYSAIGFFGAKQNRTISWSDDGRQPEDEWLYQISFPTGAYIFGEDYCTGTFNEFFVALKSFEPKYSDSNNHNLYFTSETASKVHAAFPELLKKYRGLVQTEINAKRVAELQKELKALGVQA